MKLFSVKRKFWKLAITIISIGLALHFTYKVYRIGEILEEERSQTIINVYSQYGEVGGAHQGEDVGGLPQADTTIILPDTVEGWITIPGTNIKIWPR